MKVAAHERILVALDTPDLERARTLVRSLADHVGGFKVGLELFASHGPDLVREIVDRGAGVFVDLKLHDIPNTVGGAAAAIARLGVGYFTLHASGGAAMIRRGVAAAAEAAEAAGCRRPVVLVVTVLTSLADPELESIGLAGPSDEAVLRLAGLGLAAGADGVVCSPLEVARVRARHPEAVLVVPGIRPGVGRSAPNDDQARTATPARAVASGADRLVVGRPITRADDPVAAAQEIARQIAAATG